MDSSRTGKGQGVVESPPGQPLLLPGALRLAEGKKELRKPWLGKRAAITAQKAAASLGGVTGARL